MASQSPPMMRESRIGEKQELAGLNDRLETYVAHARSLRVALETKDKELLNLRKEHDRHVGELRTSFEIELEKLRRELMSQTTLAASEHDKNTTLQSELASTRAQLVEVKGLQAERASLRTQLEQALAGMKAAEQRAASAESALKTERGMSSKMSSDLKDATAELAVGRGTLSTLRGELSQLRTAYDEATAKMQDAIRKEVAKERASWDKTHSDKIAKLERDLRAEYNAELAELKQRELHLLTDADRMRKEIARITSESTSRQNFANDAMKRIAELEHIHSSERSDWERTRQRMEEQVAKALRDLAAKVDEFNTLMDVKISLDAEIAHYRRILELEEKRTGLGAPPPRKTARVAGGAASASSSGGTWFSVFKTGDSSDAAATTETAMETTTSSTMETSVVEATRSASSGRKGRGGRRRSAESASAGRKRRHEEADDVAQEADGTNVITASDVHMSVSLDDDHVTVDNKLDEDIDLTGWSISSEVGAQRFEFPDGFKIAPGKSVTVWSGPHAVAKGHPPTHLVWSTNFVMNSHGDTAILRDAQGRIVSREKGVPATTEKRKEGDCVIM